MIDKSYIRKNTRSITYDKGANIYYAGDVFEFSVDEGTSYDRINARVQGSGKNEYQVDIVIDNERDRVEEFFCECPAYLEYEGFCKHCVAVLLEYLAYKGRRKVIETEIQRREESQAKLQKISRGMPMQSMPRTTPELKQLLERRVKQKMLPIIGKDVCGKVCLEPSFQFDGSQASVQFKIGISQMYVLKDAFEFADRMKRAEDYSYGKKLHFVHVMEAFEESYRPMAAFILRWAEDNREAYERSNPYYYYGYDTSLPKVRDLILDGEEMEAFLDAAGDQEFEANIIGIQGWCQVTSEELEQELTIQGNEQGIELKLHMPPTIWGSTQVIFFYRDKIYRTPREKLGPVLDFIKCVAAFRSGKVFVQEEDVPVFCRELLPVLKEIYQCKTVNFDEQVYGMAPAEFSVYLDMPQEGMITCRAIAVYGEKEYSVYDRETDMALRDLAREGEVGQIVSEYCNAYDEKQKSMVLCQDEELLYGLLTEGIPRMQELAEVYVSDALKRIKVMDSPKVAVGLSLSGDLLQLHLTAEEMPREELVEILSRYNRKRKFHRLKNGDFIRMEEESLSVLLELRQGLQLSEGQMRKDTIEIPRYRALYLDAELKENPSVKAVKDKNFRALIRNMKTTEDNDFEVPESLESVLREYQKKGFLWIKTLKYNGFGGILADDMGLGKTLQVIAFLLSEQEEAFDGGEPGKAQNRQTLIVCPASLVYNWKSEIERFAPDLSVKMAVGTAAERKKTIQALSERDILVTSYDLLKRDIESYEPLLFHCQVIDEAQYIKNHGTQAAKAVKTVRAGFKLALTGTPVENRLSELWSIFDYLMPGFLYSYQRFREELETPVVQNNDTGALKRLQKMIAPFILRRLKRDVLLDLPDKMEENRYVELEGEQQKLYDAHVKRMQIMLEEKSDEEFQNSKLLILTELTKLRQLCCDPALLLEGYRGPSVKTEMCVEMIRSAVEGGHKILLFSQFTTMLERIRQRLDAEKISCYFLTGATKKEKRAEMVEAFNRDDTSVFCISLKAGGTGLNLTAADIVIHYDPWWNLAVQNQATDRAHRIGQKNVVSVYKLIAKGTIEENIVKLQERKRELADKVLGGEGVGQASFTREELLELLRD